MWSYIKQLVGNGTVATIGIFVFLILLAFMFHRTALGAEVNMGAGSSFGSEGAGPVLALNYRAPIGWDNPNLFAVAGTDLWGSTTYHGQTVVNNWDWHTGLSTCRGRWCADLGAAFVQRVDAINGAHTNYFLGLSFRINSRLSLVLGHISDAGTSSPNVGRQGLFLSYRLQ